MIQKISVNGKNITLIGTAHISHKSKQQVRETILNEKPEIVAIELDRDRFLGMTQKNKREIKFSDIFRSKKPFLFMVQYFLAKSQKKIAKNYNIDAGEEMLEAIKCAKEINAQILLADRDIYITLNKLMKNLTFKDKFKILFPGRKLKKELGNNFINKLLKEVETDKENSEIINKIMDMFTENYPKLKKILIDERDQYIAYQLQNAPGQNIVAVVGAGHTQGIIKNLENKNIDIKTILSSKKVI